MSDMEFGIPRKWSLDGSLHRGKGEGEISPLEEAGALGGLRDGSGVDADLGRRCRMEEKKEVESGRGMVPMPLSNVRVSRTKPEARGEHMMASGEEGEPWETGKEITWRVYTLLFLKKAATKEKLKCITNT